MELSAHPAARDQAVRRYLPYLYVVFFFTISASLVKNYLYFRYAQDHGYLAFFNDYYRLAATIPLPVRLVALLDLPVLSPFRYRKKKETTLGDYSLYLGVATLYLATGARDTRSALLWRCGMCENQVLQAYPHTVPVLLVAV